ncbi:MAG: hypothetical protein GYA83_09725 [Deltaproteobacteria bacterium]|nr:hypothetical protein [Deltaproteobacteria bacterium]
MRQTVTRFDEHDLKEFEPEAKVGLIATVNPAGLPHITLITALQAKTPTQLIWGQFSEGQSKANVKTNPKTGFLIMTMDRSLWRGKAVWTHQMSHGDDYAMFNNKPMFRYNAYTGIHTIHYMDLKETGGREGLPLARIVLSSLLTKLAKSGARSEEGGRILKPWAEKLFNRIDTVKFCSYVGSDGFPVIIPLLACQAADSTRLAFSDLAYRDELRGAAERHARGRVRSDPGDGGRPRAGCVPRVLHLPEDHPGDRRHRLGIQLHAARARADLSGGGPETRARLPVR